MSPPLSSLVSFSSFLFLFPFLFLSFVFSFLSLSSFSVFFLCLLSPCVGGVCVVVCVCVCGVVWCAVWCGTLKTPCVDSETPPCVDSKRPRVCRQHAHMLFSMCAWCRYTRGRFECTHGERFKSTHGGRRRFSLPKNHARMVITCFRGSPKKTFRSFPCSSLRKDQEQHVPDSSNHSLYLIKLFTSSSPGETLEEPAVRWFDLYNERFAR